ncbi:Xaa-Pro peptidase family protein [Brevibacillus choshinensis]|uniref:M24 family metallopeptidase n=1 Tax=Brevibacillus choshinensis TaxID=54911 RepID=UPI002E229A04|nr:Xaa-Pro peptidase family protein [Brevibacillus choshinensis]
MQLSISKEEIKERQRRFAEKLAEKQIDAAILFGGAEIFYLTGFNFFPTERPIVFLMDTKQQSHLFLPEMEKDHAENFAYVDHVRDYYEYPSISHPMEHFRQLLLELGLTYKVIGMDAPGYSSTMGYRGPKIDEVFNQASYVSIKSLVETMRMIKSSTEIELIRESCRWANLAHQYLQKYTKEGLREIEISSRATFDATLAMSKTLGSRYTPHGNPAHAFYRGQIGEDSALPHSVTSNAVIKRGDVLISQASADVWGYKSELERTMFMTEVNDKQEEYFSLMKGAQEVAFQVMKPGLSCSEVERAVQRYYQDNGIEHLTLCHVGHSIGILGHEAPFLDMGDSTIMQSGMVFTVEPGIYVKGLGGFRHSDTVLVTDDGIEILTYYPRNLESLICK